MTTTPARQEILKGTFWAEGRNEKWQYKGGNTKSVKINISVRIRELTKKPNVKYNNIYLKCGQKKNKEWA